MNAALLAAPLESLYDVVLVATGKLVMSGLTEAAARTKCREVNRTAELNQWVTWEPHRRPGERKSYATLNRRPVPRLRKRSKAAPPPVQGPPALKQMEDFLKKFADLPELPSPSPPVADRRLEEFPCDPIHGVLLPGELRDLPYYLPSSEEIADAIAAIRSEWTPLDAYRRLRGITPDDPKVTLRKFVPRVYRCRMRAA